MSILEGIYRSTPKIQSNFKKNIIKLNFTNGAMVELVGNKDEEVTVVFLDNDTQNEIYRTTIKNNCWAKTYIRYFVNWKILFIKDNNIISDFNFSLKDKKVFIYNDSPALGDAIAWMPYIEEFRKKHQCFITYSTPYKELFEKEYPEINFNNEKKEDYYACYKITISLDDDKFLHKNKWNKIPLQQIAADILGLEYKPIRPKITIENKTNNFKRKYVTIGTQSTSQCKYWNNKNGWKETVKYLKDIGYDSVCIDRHKRFGVEGSYNDIPSNAIDKTGDYDLQSRITDIYNSEFFIGLGSGLSWLAWALNKKVILISGFSHPISEFETPYRVINYDVCNSCWNDCKFDRKDWFWCPKNRDFECSKNISSGMVIEKIKNIIKDTSGVKEKTYKDVVIFGQFSNTEEKEKIYLESIKLLNKFFDIIVVSKYPISKEIQKEANYSIYDKRNPRLQLKLNNSSFYYVDNKDMYFQTNIDGGFASWSFSVLQSIFNGISIAKENNYDNFYYIEGDWIFIEEDIKKIICFAQKSIKNNKKAYFFEHKNQKEMFCTCPLFSNIDFFIKNVKNLENEYQYLDYVNKKKAHHTLERFLYINLENKINDIEIIKENPNVYFNKSKCDLINIFENGIFFDVVRHEIDNNLYLIFKLEKDNNKNETFIFDVLKENKTLLKTIKIKTNDNYGYSLIELGNDIDLFFVNYKNKVKKYYKRSILNNHISFLRFK